MPQKVIKRILVSQPEPTNPRSPYFQIAKTYGVEFTFRPLFSIEPIGLRPLRDQKINPLQFPSVILTSRTITDHFFTQLKEQRIELPATTRYYCISEVVAGYLAKYIQVRKRRVYLPETGGSYDELQELILKKKKETFLLPAIDGQKETLSQALLDKGVAVTKYIVSKLRFAEFDEKFVKDFDMVLFFSPNGVHSLFENVPGYKQGRQILGCLGEGTRNALAEKELPVAVFAPTPEAPSISTALELFLKARRSGK